MRRIFEAGIAVVLPLLLGACRFWLMSAKVNELAALVPNHNALR